MKNRKIPNSVIEKYKARFLCDYNPQRDVKKVPYLKAINASIQRNRLYSKKLPQKARKEIRDKWENELRKLSNKMWLAGRYYKFRTAVLRLSKKMNSQKFKKKYSSTGFRISHSQKSIAVLAKHLWCLGKIGAPAMCPIDRRILKEAGARGKDQSWGHVNTWKDYEKQRDQIKKAAFPNKECNWEVVKFKTR